MASTFDLGVGVASLRAGLVLFRGVCVLGLLYFGLVGLTCELVCGRFAKLGF